MIDGGGGGVGPCTLRFAPTSGAPARVPGDHELWSCELAIQPPFSGEKVIGSENASAPPGRTRDAMVGEYGCPWFGKFPKSSIAALLLAPVLVRKRSRTRTRVVFFPSGGFG